MASLEALVAAIGAGLVGLFFWLTKRTHTRIDELEVRLRDAVDEDEVRTIIEDI